MRVARPILPLLAVLVVAAGIAVAVNLLVHGSQPQVAFTNKVAPGFVLDSSASGALTLSSASAATVVTTDRIRPRLEAAHFSSGESRVWTKGSDFAEIEIFTFRSAEGAKSVMHFSLDVAVQLAGGSADARRTVLDKVPGVPGATSFFADGIQTAGSQPLFVWGAWFTVGRHAYLIETGSQQPQSPLFMQVLTKAEYQLVAGG
jgi:hypothetical protein